MERRGIDVSFLDGNIDWGKVAQDNVEFVMLQASYGQNIEDPKFRKNIREINRTSLYKGAYHQCSATSVELAKEEAENFLDMISIGKFQLTYPVAIHMDNKNISDLGKKMASNIAETFCDMVERKN